MYQLSRSALHRKLGKNAFTSALVKAVIITAKEILLNGCSLQRESSMREGNVIRTGPWVIYLLLGLPGQQDALLPARGGGKRGLPHAYSSWTLPGVWLLTPLSGCGECRDAKDTWGKLWADFGLVYSFLLKKQVAGEIFFFPASVCFPPSPPTMPLCFSFTERGRKSKPAKIVGFQASVLECLSVLPMRKI